ncbi:3-ketodihydrosphingosine reductase domain protein [Oesophagostomum dentatum]|uniref:3-ketodihydrosphingosine reductase domain protein n=1 Tax=Oesophagostomum dentatum TaxID=61180 RepID=A0A0B1SZ78_OESDE|nr:3-ketodihydrosphingosine reductase domain protein [Oesophagostomum dentatum]
MALNYYSAVFPTRYVVPRMKKRGYGHISFVSSAAGQFAIWGYSSYSASKFALRGLADALQMELLPYNITVSVLCPPNTDTDVFRSLHTTTMPAIMRKMTAMAGLVSPKEVAKAHIRGIENGRYLTTNGLMGWFLGVGTAGASPERNLLQAFFQFLLGGIIRIVILAIIGHFNSLSRSHALAQKKFKSYLFQDVLIPEDEEMEAFDMEDGEPVTNGTDSEGQIRGCGDPADWGLSPAQLNELRAIHDSVAELLEHFWTCFPPVTSELKKRFNTVTKCLLVLMLGFKCILKGNLPGTKTVLLYLWVILHLC